MGGKEKGVFDPCLIDDQRLRILIDVNEGVPNLQRNGCALTIFCSTKVHRCFIDFSAFHSFWISIKAHVGPKTSYTRGIEL